MITQQPRIYTYKITFKGMPYWYWGVHKEERYGECYFGSPTTHKWAWEFYEPEIQILEFFPYTDEGWKEAQKVEKRLIRPDLNDPNCLNENAGGHFSLEVLRKAGRKGGAKTHAEKGEDGKSVAGKKRAAAMHAEKDADGKSIQAVRAGEKGVVALNAKLTKEERSENGKKGAAAVHEVKDGDGKSIHAVKAGAATKLACQKKVELTRVLDKATFVFDSRNDACRSLDLDRSALSRVCLGKEKTHKGFTARYLT